MKRIEAIVRTHLLDSVKDALQALGSAGRRGTRRSTAGVNTRSSSCPR